MVREALNAVRRRLLDQRCAAGHWVGALSTSALSTATACFALRCFDKAHHGDRHAAMVERGLEWLRQHQNADGGWGDTTASFSNISTTTLCWAALHQCQDDAERRAEAYLHRATGTRRGPLEPVRLAQAITRRYGDDRTFSVPILTMCALAGRLGPEPDCWRHIVQLPFELAAVPHQLYALLRLPVVSYALPALIAMGLAHHRRAPSWNPLARVVRDRATPRTLRILREIQPTTGGYLEAAPLTSFVAMTLIAAGEHDHPATHECVRFLETSVRPDGSWPIDTNLATWVTTLSVNALALDRDWWAGPEFAGEQRRAVLDWLLNQQLRVEHPYTHAAPGGWAWTDLSGGVPDADDTPGALLALRHLAPREAHDAAVAGVRWLLDLQNRDGGIPTFCRGWTGLPFDRSGADLTAHTLAAWAAWRDELPPRLRARADYASRRAMGYLRAQLRADGSWLPLWFGNQHAPDEANPVYGTSRVITALHTAVAPVPDRAIEFLLSVQNADGGWGGAANCPSSLEETGLATLALAHAPEAQAAHQRGVAYLCQRILTDDLSPAPIGFYFAKLWYFEKLYPLVFATAALSQAASISGRSSPPPQMPWR